jgi:PIN domain nuclease of toxin-antitoxin system
VSNVVLDSSAILAVINRETGADKVVDIAEGAVVSTLIIAEVVTWLAVRDTPVDQIRNTVEHFKLEIVPFDHARAYAAGLLVSKTRKRGLSLADRACLALAIELGCPVITADRPWRDVDLGVEIRLIR